MTTDDKDKMPSSREIFEGVRNMLDCFAIYSTNHGPGLTAEEADCIRQLRTILDAQLRIGGHA